MKTIRLLSRMITGLVFIFSGFVKAVDPMGSTFKFIDYFDAFSLPWLSPVALPFAILLSSLEFTIGAALILNVKIKQASWALLIFMSFFTVLTFFLAIFNPVSDCGCFGDAIILTNWETFYKNVILMVFTLIVFFGRNSFKRKLSEGGQRIMVLLVFIVISGLSVHAYMHLPLIDFLPYKKGVSLRVKPTKVDAFLIYKNNVTGEVKEWLSEELPWEDSLWVATWEYQDRRVVEYKESGMVELPMMDEFGYDISTSVFSEDGYLLLVCMPKVNKACKKSISKLTALYEGASEADISMIGASGDMVEDIDAFRHEHQILFPIYQADDITLKMVIRSNPGLLLLKDGVILKKWHYNDIPSMQKLLKNIIN
jgi:uncharacterized membrane protein YphA (DoxX/SURF4 family)/peroxiredoxin